ncbi:MAG: copper chaperone PCu(A)C [Pseudomonadota bacterium]
MKLLRGLSFAAMLAVAPSIGLAGDVAKGNLKIQSPWVRTTIPDRPSAGYMKIQNTGGTADAIVSASSPDAERIELHTHLMENGVMKMRPVEKIEVPANGSAELKSGGLHLMIFGVKKPLKDGEALPITVVFEKAGPVEMDFKITSIARDKGTRGSHSGHDMKTN